MKIKNVMAMIPLVVSTFALVAKSEQKFKTAADPCPKGTHEVIVTEEYKYQVSKDTKEITTVKDTSKGCRDNKDSQIEERH